MNDEHGLFIVILFDAMAASEIQQPHPAALCMSKAANKWADVRYKLKRSI